MSPRFQQAHGHVILHGTAMMLAAIIDCNYVPGDPHFEADHAKLQQLIRERDDIALDESDLTPECIGQLMGGN